MYLHTEYILAYTLEHNDTTINYVSVCYSNICARYNISPASLASALQSDPSVTGHARFAAEMPPGRGYAALDAASLVVTLKQAFENSVVDDF
jgi:hypothetical protein